MNDGIKISLKGEVLDIVLNRPERRNALGAAEWQAIDAALDLAEAQKAGIIRLTGTGSVFCGGVDLEMIRAAQQHDGGMIEQIRHVGGIIQKLERSTAIMIAALNGPAVGIGVHIALSADFILATKDTYLWLPEASLGIPDVQHHKLIAERVGRGRSFAFGLLGEKLGADDAHATGIFYGVLPDQEALVTACDALALRLETITRQTRLSFKRQARELVSSGSVEHQLAAVTEMIAHSQA